jgi:hypothetical protein
LRKLPLPITPAPIRRCKVFSSNSGTVGSNICATDFPVTARSLAIGPTPTAGTPCWTASNERVAPNTPDSSRVSISARTNVAGRTVITTTSVG